tara:strand:- start:400 stop:816 length:417 start_codon:yes stop_codon:yes gene_type:complete
MKFLLRFMLLVNFVNSQNLYDFFDRFGLDKTSTEIIKEFTSASGYEFIMDDYRYYLRNRDNTLFEIDFLGNFKLYSNNIDVIKDTNNPLFKINKIAYDLINIQNVNIVYDPYPKLIGLADENTYKLAVIYLLKKYQNN